MTMVRKHLVTLDGLRGLAAIMVVILHARQLLVDPNAPFRHAHLAVDFFFCLSGFVVSHAYHAKFGRGMTAGTFLVLRAVRLYPMILIGSVLGGSVYLLGNRGDLAASLPIAAAAFVLMPLGLAFGKQAFPTNNPVWSLFFEVGANMVYAIVPTLSGRLFAAALAPLALALGTLSVARGGLADIGFDDPLGFVLGWIRVAYPFAIGVWLCRFGAAERLGGYPVAVPILLLTLALLAPPVGAGYVDALCVIVVFPLVIQIAAGAEQPGAHGVLANLGRLSYPLYLSHQPVIRILRNVPAFKAFSGAHPVPAVAAALVLAMAISAAILTCIDEPVRRYLSGRRPPGGERTEPGSRPQERPVPLAGPWTQKRS